jgi:hypothetical protein
MHNPIPPGQSFGLFQFYSIHGSYVHLSLILAAATTSQAVCKFASPQNSIWFWQQASSGAIR